MKKNIVLSVITLLIFMAACQPTGEKSSDIVTDTATNPVIPADRTAVATEEDTPLTSPPDTMRANVYAANTYRKEAALVVRNKLRAMYRDELKKGKLDSVSRMFMIFEHDLDGDNKDEILVAHMGPHFCNALGCKVEVLKPNGGHVTTFTTTGWPIVISNTKTKGWKDLYVKSKGNYRILKFDGKTYPHNPAAAPMMKGNPPDNLPKALDHEHQPYLRFHF